jgi:hypothetical protein
VNDDADPGDIDIDIDIVETAPAGDAERDLISGRTLRSPRQWPIRPSRLAGLLVIVLLAGIGIGYLIGHSGRAEPMAAPSPLATTQTAAPAPAVPPRPLALSGPTCAIVDTGTGRARTVGVQLVNSGPQPLVLTAVHGVVPVNGLQPLDSYVGQCDQSTRSGLPYAIAARSSAWLSLNLVVRTPCPVAPPVELWVGYAVGGAGGETVLSFPDLGPSPYPSCPAH